MKNWLLTGLVVVAVLLLGLYTKHLDNNRINEIQHSRVVACQRGYESFREVFHPFFRPPKQRTPKERRDIKKFNKIVSHLKSRCATQVY